LVDGFVFRLHIKNDKKASKETILEIVTEGILTRRLQNDPELSGVALIIFDEFHERSIHADISLMLALEIQNTIREDLKLLVMSATIDTGMVSNYMNGADIIECPGRVFPVTVSYIGSSKSPLSQQVIRVLAQILASKNLGDTLVFLPGQAEIRRCLSIAADVFNDRCDLIFLPLFGSLSLQQQEQVLSPDSKGRRRIIFTTNIAETSLTIEGVTCVVDSGLEKILVYDPSSYMTRLETVFISKASAEQRKGRAGRTQAGTCFRLWDQAKQQKLRDFQGEEILSADLTGLVLELFLWGESHYDAINWLTPPPIAHFNSAITTLLSLGLMTADNKLTALGKQATGLGLSPRLASMVLQANDDIEKSIACELSVLLSEKDIFTQNKGSDLVNRLIAIQDFKNDRHLAVKSYPIKRSSMEQFFSNLKSLRRSLSLKPSIPAFSLEQLETSIGGLLLNAYPDRLAKRRSHNNGRYQLANGKGVLLFDDDPLFGSEWLVVANCDAQKKEGRIFSAAQLPLNTIIANAGHSLVDKEEYSFDKKSQKVTGRLVTRYGAIDVKSSKITNIPPDKFQSCLLQIFEDAGLDILHWSQKCEVWLTRVSWLGLNLETFPKISKQSLINDVEHWLMPYLSNITTIEALKKVNIFNLLLGLLSWDEQQLLEKEAPTHYRTPSNKSIPITYDGQQGPTVSVVLQEMFGEIESPTIAGGHVFLRFELLSPARRPIQTTSDIGNFWKTSYFDVAKDMKGRYPKHRWPEQPLLEKAGRSIKR